ncbi:hypothetical protein [Ferribacterium limneticum]|uniref:hypothetical protein n=1 Tax=Ferribacterium limneticum TaxID=76259 RepID=UPI001CF819BD|nr:hypothetical protein [Ferribacterium limneticum]UCV21916.1 hypothetical protein KI613_15460 [Ferribacterium limneticum]
MTSSARHLLSLLIAPVLAMLLLAPAHAVPSLSNGGFEAGLSGWTTADQTGSDGTFYVQSGILSPASGSDVPAPPQGTSAAMSDAGAPGSHVLYQDFVASAGNATLSFQLFIGNRADAFYTPATLDFSTPELNQQARVDILTTSADPFSVMAADILITLYQTNIGDVLVDGYFTVSQDISALLAAHSGETLRLRFAEVDNVFISQMGVDNVRFESNEIPEPALSLLLGIALLALVATPARWRNQRR